MSAPEADGLVFRQDYFGDRTTYEALADLLQGVFDIDIRKFDCADNVAFAPDRRGWLGQPAAVPEPGQGCVLMVSGKEAQTLKDIGPVELSPMADL